MAIKTWKELLSAIDPTLDASNIALTQISASLELPDGRKIDLPIRADSTVDSLKAAFTLPSPPKEEPEPESQPQILPTAPKITSKMRQFMREFFETEADQKEFIEFAAFDDKAKQFFGDVSNPIEAYETEYQAIPGVTDLEKFKNFLYNKPTPASQPTPEAKVETQPIPAPALTNKSVGKGPKKKKQ